MEIVKKKNICPLLYPSQTIHYDRTSVILTLIMFILLALVPSVSLHYNIVCLFLEALMKNVCGMSDGVATKLINILH